jgi:hypothetical protein
MSLGERVAADVDADQQIGLEFLQRGPQSLDYAFDAAVDVDQQYLLAAHRRHARLGEINAGLRPARRVREPRAGMERAHVFDFVERPRTGDRIVHRALPRESAQPELQAAKLQKLGSHERADDVAAAAHADDERAARAADESSSESAIAETYPIWPPAPSGRRPRRR